MSLKKEAELTKNSYYEASVTRPTVSPALAERITADVCIVGGGFSGLSAALELTARGYSVALLEAQKIGWGQSGRNGGQVLAGFSSDDAVEAQFSSEDARRAWHLTVEGMQLLRERITTHAIDCDFVDGVMILAVNAKKGRALDKWVNHLMQAYDYHMKPIADTDIGNWIASERYYSGAFDANSGHLHPLKYCLGLSAAARATGVQIFENSPVIHVSRGERPVVKTSKGEVVCNFVVLAGNVYLNEYGNAIAPEVKARIMPVGTYIIATEPMDKERVDALIRHRSAVFDTNFVLDYFRPTADHRLLFGGRASNSAATPANLLPSMQKRMLTVFPQLKDVAVSHVWGGFVDITMNRAPDFGRLGNNIYYLQGFSGHGVAVTGMAGKLVAEAIAGQAERFDLLSRIKHHSFPGGALMRRPALMLGRFYYQLRELF